MDLRFSNGLYVNFKYQSLADFPRCHDPGKYILPCEFQKQCNKLMKLNIKPFAEQGTIALDPWVYYPSALADFRNELMSDCCEKPRGVIYVVSLAAGDKNEALSL